MMIVAKIDISVLIVSANVSVVVRLYIQSWFMSANETEEVCSDKQEDSKDSRTLGVQEIALEYSNLIYNVRLDRSSLPSILTLCINVAVGIQSAINMRAC